MLARTVAGWGWENETVELLWGLSRTHEMRRDALQQLYGTYAQKGDTAGLYRVLVRAAELTPDDPMVQNNLAQVALLLDVDHERARKLAADVVAKEPANPAYVSTLAYSLYTQGDVAGAVAAFERLPLEQLEFAPIALYYGIVLSTTGQKEKAQQYLERGAKAFMLPEEKALFEKAQHATR
jgi:tetratricopeptide (TPR) repeat protein